MGGLMVAVAMAVALLGSWIIPVQAQNDGIVIENNGTDNSNSAAGADNVNISRAAGNSSSNNGAGANNEAGRVVKENGRDRKDRANRDNGGGGGEAPVDAAPVGDGYQEYAVEDEWVEPLAAPEELVAEQPAETIDPNLPIKLPNTGAGAPHLAIGAMIAAIAACFASIGLYLRRSD